jgi:type 2 lantibiotic biosynthesis protein LanM
VVDAFYERLRFRAATIDELLSDAFEPSPDANSEADMTARRFAAWCRAAAAGDQSLFARRLERDRLTMEQVRVRLTAARPRLCTPRPAWIDDAVWIEAALQGAAAPALPMGGPDREFAFEELFLPLVAAAETRLWQDIGAAARNNLDDSARACFSRALLAELSALAAPAIYERFSRARGASGYAEFIIDMKSGGMRRLFEDKPVLLRLLATLIRQWIDASREFVLRLEADLPALRRELLTSGGARVTAIEGDLSDLHNGGRSVRIVSFADGVRLLYKPKDLRLDVAWHDLIGRLNRADPPVTLQAPRALARDGYGWTEFIDHVGCADTAACGRFFRRAGAWLALLHVFVATDMHQENMIAAGEHPVPIDLETILQPSAEEHKTNEPEGEAFDAAMDVVANSVMTVGLLPAYGRSADNNVFAMGGMTADWGARTVIKWNDINSNAMRPFKAKEPGETNTNLPHVGGRYAKFADHISDFVAGFADYATFLLRRTRKGDDLFAGFSGLPVRRVIRPTRFYYMLLQRLEDHRSMDDGAVWSAQADFMARLADWDRESDPLWPLQRAERAALLALNVPHFVSPSDGTAIADAVGTTAETAAASGLARARARVQNLNEKEIGWQIEVIEENTGAVTSTVDTTAPELAGEDTAVATKETFLAEADRIAAELSRHAIRRGPGAAWIGLDWLGDAEVFQLVCLGPDLYNGAAGIALFLSAHAAVAGAKPSAELALAAVARLRTNLSSRSAARLARALGTGGATGLGSIVYAFAAMGKLLGDDGLLADADAAAKLFTDELIAADKQLDVTGGSAGAILALLRLYRDTQSPFVLGRAVKCGEHLLAQSRIGPEGRRSWAGQGSGAKGPTRGLNGMSHGAAGFAYALAALAAATGRDDFAATAAECIAFEDSTYDAARHNWPDLRTAEPHWPCQWCHGAPGIGLARLGARKRGAIETAQLATDIAHAATGVAQSSLSGVDTLCCGTLGRIEFFCEAADVLGRSDLRKLAAQRLTAVMARASATGDYRWNAGKRQFNVGLFRGLSGVGYTLLRQADASLPNVLIWE